MFLALLSRPDSPALPNGANLANGSGSTAAVRAQMATILIVDDNAINREFLAALMAHAKHSVVHASNGAEALDCIARMRPDLIITDLMMPVMDGLELVNRLRADPATATIPVMFYTATYRVHEAREMARSCGVELVLPKPSEPQLILDSVRSLLGTQASADSEQVPEHLGAVGVGPLRELVGLQQRLYDVLEAGPDGSAHAELLRGIDMRGQPLVFVHALSLRLAALLELHMTLSSERDPQRLLNLFCRAAQDIMGVCHASLVIADGERGSALAWAASGLSESGCAKLAATDLNIGFAAEVMHSARPLRRSLDADSEFEFPPHGSANTRSVLATPLRSPAGVAGVLWFVEKTGGADFNEEDEQFASTLAAQLGLAYGNLKLLEDVQRHAGQLQIEVVERKRVSEKLRESETRFRQMAESIPSVFFLREPGNARFLYVSPAYAEIWGQSCQSLYDVPMSWVDAVHPDDRARILAINERASVDGRFEYEHRIVRADGSIRWVHSRGFPIHDSQGRLIRIAGIAEDISERKQVAEVLRESEMRFRQLAENIRTVFFLVDAVHNSTLYVSPSYETIWGLSRASLYADPLSWASVVHPDDRERVLRTDHPDARGASFDHEYRIIRPDGELRWIWVRGFPIRDENGALYRIAATAEDITERFEQERKIARLSRIRAVIGGISSAMLRLRNRDELLQEACRVAATEGVFPLAWVTAIDVQTQSMQIIGSQGLDSHSIENMKSTLLELVPAPDRLSYRAAISARPVIVNDLAGDPGMAPIQAHLVRFGFRSGVAFPLLVSGQVVAVLVLFAAERDFFDAEEVALLTWLTDDLSFALEGIEKSAQLEHLAYYDALTGLSNARLFHDRLNQFINVARHEQSKVCVVVVDLEGFTLINDAFGRNLGDELLRQVGARFASFMVEPYALSRIAGDTFVAASPRDGGAITTHLRDRMLDSLKQPFVVYESEILVKGQAGIALFPADGDDASKVFKNAEAALRLAKSSGQPYQYYSSEMNARIAQRRALQDQLRDAVESRQFVMHYQSRIDMISGELIGAEALIRWQHPDKGLVAPLEFIPVAEETGLIVPIGAWVIETVCAQQASWLATGLRIVPIAVNLSSVQFEKGDLLQTVVGALTANRLEPRFLDLELTESAVMNDPIAAATTLQAFRQLGVGLALDDFGTGFSSLAHLKRFPFDSVKIDRSFVTDITSNPEDAAIATAIIAMAHTLKLKVVAEGVETQGQFNCLRAQSCDEMQGHFFGPAVPAQEFEAHLRSSRRMNLPQLSSAAQPTLLVVDDEPGIRAALTRMLRPDGYRILTAANGAEGLDLLSLHVVQVIISDQRMPGMSGTDFLSKVKQLYPDTVRIILSGYTDLAAVTDAVNRGSVFKFLTKPWDDDLLREQVRDAFRRYRPQQQTGDGRREAGVTA